MSKQRKASRKQIDYIKTLEQQLPPGEAARISKATLKDPRGLGVNVFLPLAIQPRSFSRERIVDHISGSEATDLINAMLDRVGRKGRRRNNR